MFKSEADFSELIHNKPGIILSGIPEINPDLCPYGDTLGKLLPLGREITLDRGSIDNLYIDANAVLTFVECKRYSDSRIKRDVYSQAMNYAADIRGMLEHYNGQEFLDRFVEIISKSGNPAFSSIDSVLETLSKDRVLDGKNTEDWKKQFPERLELNIKNGTCRIIIACAPDPRSHFASDNIRNLMKLMQFSQSTGVGYDLILMDVRESGNRYDSRIIWRNYASLPLIPTIKNLTRDTSRKIEELRNTVEGLPPEIKSQLYTFISLLDKRGICTKDTATKGIALYWKESGKPLYIYIQVQVNNWFISSPNVKDGDKLFPALENDNLVNELNGFDSRVVNKNTLSGDRGVSYTFDVYRTKGKSFEEKYLGELADLVSDVLQY